MAEIDPSESGIDTNSRCFEILLSPQDDDFDEAAHVPVQMALVFAHTEKYPDEPPLVNIKSVRGIKPDDLTSLKEKLDQEKLEQRGQIQKKQSTGMGRKSKEKKRGRGEPGRYTDGHLMNRRCPTAGSGGERGWQKEGKGGGGRREEGRGGGGWRENGSQGWRGGGAEAEFAVVGRSPERTRSRLEATENLGMAMIYTLLDSAKEWLTEKYGQNAGDEEPDETEEPAEEVIIPHGEAVTVESFMAWRERFEAELALQRAKLMPESALTAPKEKKLSGRQYFESGRHITKGAGTVAEEDEEEEEEDIEFDDDFEDDEEDMLEHFLAEQTGKSSA
ncbi:RWD domain-containing protein 1 [Triticum urartu]|uniref:RWD domain-containing protein 1 n=1 Tax=Triticum urartu TaxID=4572 RepID=M8AQ76_TRIUA|nr:RWD domain-containing protein 1 [Triticum urartu]